MPVGACSLLDVGRNLQKFYVSTVSMATWSIHWSEVHNLMHAFVLLVMSP